MSESRFPRLALLLGVVFNLLADQGAKLWVRKQVVMGEQKSLLGKWFTLTHVENNGAFLSLGTELTGMWRLLLLNVLPLLALLVGLAYVFRSNQLSKAMQWGLVLVLSGGLGNVIDRFRFGAVTDFWYIDLGWAHTGVFNVADLQITTGECILVYLLLVKRKPQTA